METILSPKEILEAKWIKIVSIFLYITVVWNVIEGAVSIYFGYGAGDLSLFAFGIDSWIEVLSASLVLYNMIFKSLPNLKKKQNKLKRISLRETTPLNSKQIVSTSALFTLETERKLTLFIGLLLIIFCLFACVGGVFRLVEGIPPSSTMVGIIVGGVCVIAMAILWYYKTKAAVILNSSTLASDAACSLGCIKLSSVLLIGSILYEIWTQLWWVDAVTAILIGLLVGYEGYETVKGAMDREKFQGGCGCCGASDTGLAKYFRIRIENELKIGSGTASTANGMVKDDGDDDCCGGGGGCCDNDNDDDDICIDVPEEDDCCSGGTCNKTKTKTVKSYGSVINNQENENIKSGCGGGDCCGSK